MPDRKLRADPADRLAPTPRRRRKPAPGPPGRSGRPRSRPAGAFEFCVLLLLWTVILGGGVLGYFALTLPDTGELAKSQRRPSVTMLAADGSLIATYGDLFGQPLTLQGDVALSARGGDRDRGPPLLQPFRHRSDRAGARGLRRSAAGHVVQGGSTITQQLAKNLFLTPERTIARKIRETLLALWLEHRFTKNQILEIYLNRVYLGAGTYGVDAAAHRYFDKSAQRIDLYQSALIAGLLKAPTRFNPMRDRDDGRGANRAGARQHGRGRLHHQTRGCRGRARGAPLAAVRHGPAGKPLFRRLGRRATGQISPAPPTAI